MAQSSVGTSSLYEQWLVVRGHRAKELVLDLQQERDELSVEIEKDINELAETFSIDNYEVEKFSIKPRRSDIFNIRMMLLWEMVADQVDRK